jgi:hypothetical protein
VLCSKEKLLAEVERVRHEPGAKHRNRLGILLGNTKTKDTKTLTHTLWSLLNVLPAGDWQRPHKHNSVALDLAVHAAPGKQTVGFASLTRCIGSLNLNESATFKIRKYRSNSANIVQGEVFC